MILFWWNECFISGYALVIAVPCDRQNNLTALTFTAWPFILEKEKKEANKKLWVFVVTYLWLRVHSVIGRAQVKEFISVITIHPKLVELLHWWIIPFCLCSCKDKHTAVLSKPCTQLYFANHVYEMTELSACREKWSWGERSQAGD